MTKVRVVLVGTEGEINLGFIARLVKNFDADELVLVEPRVQIGDEALRFAAHAKDVLLERTRIVKTLDEALRDVSLSACTSARVGQKTDVLRHPLTPWEFAEKAAEYTSVAVVFGRESTGLTREEILKCDVLVSIPASRAYPVLNLSHAVAIVLYELFKRIKLGSSQYRVEPAREQYLRILEERLRCIAEHVMEGDQRLPQAVAAVKHLVHKAGLTAGEAGILIYLAKRIAAALGLRECIEGGW